MGDEQHGMGQAREARWAALLRDANRGGRAAYVQFLTETAPVLRGIIAARCGRRHEECEDILQTVLIAIHEKRHTWRETEPVSAWIYAIARYKTVDALRRAGRDRTAPFDGAEVDVPDETVIDPTAAADLERLLVQLDAVSAGIVRQIKLQGLTAEEVGLSIGMTPGAVRVALHRAMARLAMLAQDGAPPQQTKGPRP